MRTSNGQTSIGSKPDSHRRWRRHGVRALILALLVSLAGTLGGVPASGDDGAGPSRLAQVEIPTVGVTGVTVTDDDVQISGSLTAGASGDLFVLGAEASATIGASEPVATVTAGADGAFRHTLPRIAADGTDLLFAQFVVAQDGEVIGSPHFADDFRFTPANRSAYPEAQNKKGLQVQLTDDAEELGVQHAGINVDLAQIMLEEPQAAEDTIEFSSGGQTYYFDRDSVNGLDTQIKPLSDRGVLVNLIVLLYQHAADANSAADILIHPDAVVEPGAGPVYGFNTETAEGRRYLTAAMEFIASRWSRPDGAYGNAVGYIVGNEVNAQWVWSNSGDKTLDEFMDVHSRAIRLMSQAAKKYFGEARTYLSLEHHWTIHPAANPDPENPTRYYEGRDVVNRLNEITKTTGDFDWYVAYHPYPENLFQPDFWNDVDATPDVDTKKITFKNIEVLPEYLDEETLRFDGEPRRIILSEQGCNTPGVGNAMTLENEKLQAACYAYAYYKIRFLPSIDNFILHRHVDHRQEGGLNLGLWAADWDSSFAAAPLRHKYSYDVFSYIDTERSLEVTEFAKEIIGIEDWADVIEGFDPAALNERAIPIAAGARLDAAPSETRPLARFRPGDADGWEAADNVAGVTPSAGALTVKSQAKGPFASQWRGVVKDFTHPVPVRQDWLAAQVRLPEDSGLGQETVVRLKATLASGTIVYGDANVPADGQVHSVAASLEEVADGDRLSRVKVWLRGTGTTQPSTTFDLTGVSLASELSDAGRPNLVAEAAVSAAEVEGSTLTVKLTNLGDQPLNTEVTLGGDCGDLTVQPATARIADLAFGATASVEATVTGTSDADTPQVCVAAGGTQLLVPVTVPPPTVHPLSDFESDDGGWGPGQNVAAVERVTGFANGPTAPHGGSYALEASSDTAAVSAPRSVVLESSTPIDLSDASTVVAWLDSYGGAPGATGYTAAITLSGEDGTTRTAEVAFTPDRWNEVSVDVSDWAGRSAVTRMEVSLQPESTESTGWGMKFQVDDVGYFT